MDDVLVLAPTRWKLRRAVKTVNCVLASLRLDKHPDKTFVGPIERGFDFLGYHFAPGRLTVARKTQENFVARLTRLYEQEPDGSFDLARLWDYVRRWWRWVCGGLSGLCLALPTPPDKCDCNTEPREDQRAGFRHGR